MGSSLENIVVTLNDGNSIPVVGLGVFQVPPAVTEQAVSAALRVGYRHIGTAAAYRNERETGRAVANSGVPRDQLYVVTKLRNADRGYNSTPKAFDASTARLGLDYLDLYLIHWLTPALNKFVDTFKAFAHLRDQGRIRSIGAISSRSTSPSSSMPPASCPRSTRSSCIRDSRSPNCGRCMPTAALRRRRGRRWGRERC
jgi:2,5-diketo-D-gluconate reductase A